MWFRAEYKQSQVKPMFKAQPIERRQLSEQQVCALHHLPAASQRPASGQPAKPEAAKLDDAQCRRELRRRRRRPRLTTCHCSTPPQPWRAS